MSTAKMVADSTVSSDIPSERRKRRKSSESRRNKKSKKSSSKDHSKDLTSEDSDSDLDLSKDMLAIGGYIKDRSEMVEQMFRAVRGPSLRRALPDILMDLPLTELKKRCLEQLEIMSRKRILRILSGDIPAEISSSGTEDSSGEGEIVGEEEEHESDASSEQAMAVEVSEEEDEKGSEEGVEKGDESGEEVAEASEDEEEVESEAQTEEKEEGSGAEDPEEEDDLACGVQAESEDSETVVEEVEYEDEESMDKDNVPSESHKEDARSENSDPEANNATPAEGGQPAPKSLEVPSKSKHPAPTLTKEQMEILELEMRARAIKAMLNKHPPTLIPLLPTGDCSTSVEFEDTPATDRNLTDNLCIPIHLSKDNPVDAAIIRDSRKSLQRRNDKKVKGSSKCETVSSGSMSLFQEPTSLCCDSQARVSEVEEELPEESPSVGSEESEVSSVENNSPSDNEENYPSVGSSTLT